MNIREYEGKKYKIFSSPNIKNGLPKEPFHNDKKMLKIIIDILNNVEVFIETGTFMGKTLYFVGENFPNLQCYSWILDVSMIY